jgi:uncharacterized protein (DUF2267 family)
MAETQQAVSATRATLETLAERIHRGEASDAAAQLPPELAVYLENAREDPDNFSAQEFVKRVAAREEADVPDAAYHARVVLDVLSEALTAPELAQVRGQLPDDYDALFEAGTKGDMDIEED